MSKLEGYSLDLVNRIVWKISDLDIFGDFETVEDAIREYLGDNLGNEVLIAIGEEHAAELMNAIVALRNALLNVKGIT